MKEKLQLLSNAIGSLATALNTITYIITECTWQQNIKDDAIYYIAQALQSLNKMLKGKIDKIQEDLPFEPDK